MAGRTTAFLAIRTAVRRALADLDTDVPVLVGCSGGADSMALTAATLAETSVRPRRVEVVVVDHGLRPDSAAVSARVAAWWRSPDRRPAPDLVTVLPVQVGSAGGPEAAARTARYALLDDLAERTGGVVLLGHTLDDQAETVLLGLARGSGLRSIAGMRPVTGPYRRPLLGLRRAQTAAACVERGLPVATDPTNDDVRLLRARVRSRVLPVLEGELGPGVAEALARTAELAATDADALDALAAELLAAARLEPPSAGGVALSVEPLERALPAVRRRVLRAAALAAGSPGGELFAVHVYALDDLVTRWHGQRAVDLPGHVRATRTAGVVVLGRIRRSQPAPGRAD